MRLWVEGRVAYEDLKYTTKYDLADVAAMNEALDVRNENTRRLNEYYAERSRDADR